MKLLHIFLLITVALCYGQCPLNFSPEDACTDSDPSCGLFQDADEDIFCDNPGPQSETSEQQTELIEEEQFPDFVSGLCCPLKLTPEEACVEDSPRCAFYTDSNLDAICDNPGIPIGEETCSLIETSSNGCPLFLSPESACPDSFPLCPHYFAYTSGTNCKNPMSGKTRAKIMLVTLVVLLPLSTLFSRTLRGRRASDKKMRKRMHIIVHCISLLILGFIIQGCFCPLGAFQFLFLRNGMIFLGWFTLAIFLLPILYTIIFGRIFCSWVCPMGALQHLLHRVPVPKFLLKAIGLDHILKYMKYLILLALVLFLILARTQNTGEIWPAYFCRIDPFHTIFSFFLVGNFYIGVLTILLSLLFGRFFCRYFCFYGAIQTIACRFGAWSGIRRLFSKKTERICKDEDIECSEIPSD